ADAHDLAPGIVGHEGDRATLLLPTYHQGVVIGVAAVRVHDQSLIVIQVGIVILLFRQERMIGIATWELASVECGSAIGSITTVCATGLPHIFSGDGIRSIKRSQWNFVDVG